MPISNETLSEDERQIIQGALAYANEPNLKGRLDDMLREYGYIFNFKESERKMFVKNVANSHNYHTHYDESRESTALKDMELYELAINLRALLISAVLTKIGVNKELIKKEQTISWLNGDNTKRIIK